MKQALRLTALILALLILAACGAQQPAATTAPAGTTKAPIVETTILPTEAGPSEIRNIIIIIGDGMGDAQLDSGELGLGKEYAFRSWQSTHSNTNSLDEVNMATKVTDSAAGGTALSTGTLTLNKYLGKDKDGNDLKTILDHAKEYGKATGVVTTDAITGATPASYSAHCVDREDTQTILYTQIESNVDMLCANKTSEAAEMKPFFEKAGYTFCDMFSNIKKTMDAEKAFWQFNMAGTGATDKLEKVVPYALDFLDKDEDGFVMMIEQAHIDKYCHSNQIDGTILMSDSLNNTVEAVLSWLGDRNDTAIIITADHETGSLKVSPEKKYPNNFSANGNSFYYLYGSGDHSDTPVSVYVYGFQADFTPYYMDDTQELIKNKSVFELMLDLLKNPERTN
jgi:alkaline phosphatase